VKEGVANNGVMEKQAQASNKACGCGNSVANAAVIELHAPTSSTQKLKLMGRSGQFAYIPTHPPHVEAPLGPRRGIGASSNYFI